MTRQQTIHSLSDPGVRVAEAADGRQGLSLAIELPPQVMLVDLLAAELDGIELTRTLRQFKAGRRTCGPQRRR